MHVHDLGALAAGTTSSSISGYSSRIGARRSSSSAAAAASDPRHSTDRARQASVADLADQDPVKLRARPELLGSTLEDPLRRADLAQPSDGIAHALERIRAPHVVELDDLALEREQLDQRAFDAWPGGQRRAPGCSPARSGGSAVRRARRAAGARAARTDARPRVPTQLIPNGRPARSIARHTSPARSLGTSASARQSDSSSQTTAMPASEPAVNGETRRGSPDRRRRPAQPAPCRCRARASRSRPVGGAVAHRDAA